ncbi:hypothetical protein, partial [Blastococcus litoris]|uniref:hypothetical protein n=1 Tax=Blastococcus litoris TaxID=2171622 RepID=UPI0019D14CCD
HGWFEGIWCDSTYEMAYVWYCQNKHIPLSRNHNRFSYVDANGRTRYYIPDFIVDGKYVEIKGWMRPEDYFKISQFPHDIDLVSGTEIKKIVCLAQEHFQTKHLATLFSERSEIKQCGYCGRSWKVVSENRKKKFCNNSCSSKFRWQSMDGGPTED